MGELDLNVSPFIVGPPSEGVPTYAENEDDGQWHFRPWTSLSAGSSEKPGPITMAMPWAAERYRVWVRLDEKSIEKGYLRPERFVGEGLSGFIQKPYRSDSLRAKLREVLGG